MSVLPPGEIDHIGIAVRDIDAACARYVELSGARAGHREVLVEQGVEVLFLHLPGETRLELISPLGAEGGVARFLERRGEGLHHICMRVTDLDAALRALGEHDVPRIDEVPRSGAAGARIAFLHPEALGGVLLELKEPAA